MTKRPYGCMWKTVLSSRYLAGMTLAGDDLPHQVLARLLQGHVIGVLDRHDDGVHALRDAHAFLHAIRACHLGCATHTLNISSSMHSSCV